MKDKKRALAHAAGIAVMLLVVAYIVHSPGHIPPYDANLVQLADTERQGYCSGVTFWRTSGQGDAGRARACRAEYRDDKSGRISMVAAERGFCQGIVDEGWDGGSAAVCVEILRSYQYWPTLDGSITDQWNRARPYPGTIIDTGTSDSRDDSRTGGRPGSPGHAGPSRSDYEDYYYGGGTP